MENQVEYVFAKQSRSYKNIVCKGVRRKQLHQG